MICKKCNEYFPTSEIINGKRRMYNKRKYCLKCSKFGDHNTKLLELYSQDELYFREKEGYKKCLLCKEIKSIDNFYNKNKNNTKSSLCKKCFIEDIQKRQIKNKLKAINYLGGKCQKCGYSCPQALTFHHRDIKSKELMWNKLKRLSWSKILKEITKCDLLCSNCHILVHSNLQLWNI